MSESLPRALLPLALMGVIFYLSAQSDPGADIGPAGRIGAHAGEYFALTIAWSWALAPALRRPAPVAALIAFLYAISDEYHQSFVPDREADPFDLAVDLCGIALAVLATPFLARRLAGRRSASSPGRR